MDDRIVSLHGLLARARTGRRPVERRAVGLVLVTLAAALTGLAGTVAAAPARSPGAGPASMSTRSVATTEPVLTPVPLPGGPSAVLMATPSHGWLAAGDALYRSGDGGHSWQTAFAHCATAQMAGEPCGEPLTGMAELPDGTVLMASDQSSSLWSIGRSGAAGGPPLVTLPGPVWEGPWVIAGTAFAAVEEPGPASRFPTAPVTLLASPDGRHWAAVGRIPARDPVASGGARFLVWASVLGRDRWAAAYGAGDCSLPWQLALTADAGRRWQAVRPPLFGYGTWLAPAPGGGRWLMGGPACRSAAPRTSQGLFTSAPGGRTWRPVVLRRGVGPVTPEELRFALSGGAPPFQPRRGDLIVDVDATATFGGRGMVAVGGYTALLGGDGVPASPVGPGGPATPDGEDGALVLISHDGGASWTVNSLPGFPTLTLVSCAEAGPCLLGSTSTGTGWLLAPSPMVPPPADPLAEATVATASLPGVPANATLAGVSCPAVGDCEVAGSLGSPDAAGTSPLVVTWSGTTFSRTRLPAPGTGGAWLTAVSCPAPGTCAAVGSENGGRGPLAFILGGHGWVAVPVPAPAGAVQATLTSVACASAVRCLALGTWSRLLRADTGGTFAAAFDGRSWRSIPPPPLEPAGLACPAPDDCLAVGSTGRLGQARAAASRWDGRGWLPEVVPSAGRSSSLGGIACLSPLRCWAAGETGSTGGQRTLVLALDAARARWRAAGTPDVALGYDPLAAIACVPAGCLAAGQTWFRVSGPTHLLLLAGASGRWAVLPVYSPPWSGYTSAVACAERGTLTRCLAVGSREAPHGFKPYAVVATARTRDPARSAAARSAPARIGPSAVWPAAWRDQVQVFTDCARAPAGQRPCIERFMRSRGASGAAISFFAATGRYLTAFVDTGRVDVGYTAPSSPMSGGGGGFVLLNGRPPDLVPRLPSLASPAYAQLRAAYRLAAGASALDILSGVPWLETARTQPNGRETIVVQYPINDQCNACATPYRARVAYRFSSADAYVGMAGLGPCERRLPGEPAGRIREPACPATHPGPQVEAVDHVTGHVSHGAFAPLIRAVMARLGTATGVRLVAPVGPLGPLVAEPVTGHALGAWFQAGSSTCTVHLGYCPPPAATRRTPAPSSTGSWAPPGTRPAPPLRHADEAGRGPAGHHHRLGAGAGEYPCHRIDGTPDFDVKMRGILPL